MNTNQSDNIFVADLQKISLEKLVKSKLEVLFQQMDAGFVETRGLNLYKTVNESVEKALIELSLAKYKGNQTKTAQMLGINRNTLKKKIDTYDIKAKKQSL